MYAVWYSCVHVKLHVYIHACVFSAYTVHMVMNVKVFKSLYMYLSTHCLRRVSNNKAIIITEINKFYIVINNHFSLKFSGSIIP